ncbi:MAG: hypothetical protein M3Q73_00200, partial [bacterium]|nr:hypothetical protein [bacterium]
MIATEFYHGQGLGNQLWCYVTTRVIAIKKGYDFGIVFPERFKGNEFMRLDFGKPVTGVKHHYTEWSVLHPDGSDIRTRDEKLVNVADYT